LAWPFSADRATGIEYGYPVIKPSMSRWCSLKTSIYYNWLVHVGGFNPSEKYESQLGCSKSPNQIIIYSVFPLPRLIPGGYRCGPSMAPVDVSLACAGLLMASGKFATSV
jgi:hypothetical protein